MTHRRCSRGLLPPWHDYWRLDRIGSIVRTEPWARRLSNPGQCGRRRCAAWARRAGSCRWSSMPRCARWVQREAWRRERELARINEALGPARTGWSPGLLQDDSRPLAQWLASRVDARRCVREAREERERKERMG